CIGSSHARCARARRRPARKPEGGSPEGWSLFPSVSAIPPFYCRLCTRGVDSIERSRTIGKPIFLGRTGACMGTKTQVNMAKSEEVIRTHKEYLWPAVTNFYQQPLVADRAHMQYVWDLEGRKYLDFFGGILTISVGHTNPKVTSKIKAQVDRL